MTKSRPWVDFYGGFLFLEHYRTERHRCDVAVGWKTTGWTNRCLEHLTLGDNGRERRRYLRGGERKGEVWSQREVNISATVLESTTTFPLLPANSRLP